MEENDQRMERGNIWSNIWQLVRIHLIQQENLLIGACGSIIIYFLFIAVCVIGAYYASGNVRYYEILNGYSGIVWVGILCILVPAYQLFTNEAISMYPGNAVTRFWGRIIADHARLFVYILCLGMAYIMQCGLLWLCLQGKSGVDIQMVFDVRYLGVGLLRICVISMALYSIFAFFLVLDARFGNRFSICLLLMILGMGYYFMGHRPKFIVLLWEWIQKRIVDNTDLFSYLTVFVLVWLVGILAAGILACHVRYWRIGYQTRYIVAIVTASFLIGIISLTSVLNETQVEYDEESSYMQYGAGDLYSSILVSLPEGNSYSMDEDMVRLVDENSGKKRGDLYDYINNDDNIGYSIGSVSEARDLGIPEGVDLSNVDDDHAVLVYQLHNVRVNGQEIYRDLMKDMSQYLRQVESQSKLELEYCGRLQSTICVDCFSSVDRFLYRGSDDMTMAEYYNRIPFLQTTLLMSDARYEAYERAMDE